MATETYQAQPTRYDLPVVGPNGSAAARTATRPYEDDQMVTLPPQKGFVGDIPTREEARAMIDPGSMTLYDIAAVARPTEEVPVPVFHNDLGGPWERYDPSQPPVTFRDAALKRYREVHSKRVALGQALGRK